MADDFAAQCQSKTNSVSEWLSFFYAHAHPWLCNSSPGPSDSQLQTVLDLFQGFGFWV